MKKIDALRLGIALISFLLVVPVFGSHFRGAIISWRPVNPSNFDGNIEITHRIAWRRGTAWCDANTIANRQLIGGGSLICRSGCSGTLGSMSFYCTDFSADEDWSSGERTYIVNVGTSISSFEASFASCCWIRLASGGGYWEVRVKGDLSVRSDTGTVNTSPVSATQPIIRFVYNQARTISIPVQDADGDIIRCRWATSSEGECGGVCSTFSYGTLDGNACTLTYNGGAPSSRWYAVALQIEDFATASSTTPLSSVPLQFLVYTFVGTVCSCPVPIFVDTLADDACVGVDSGTQFTQRITAQTFPCTNPGSCSSTISNIQTVSPLGFTKSGLTRISGTNQWYIDVTWTPSTSQTGPQIFCYQAFDNYYQSSEQRCITLLSGVSGPALVPKSDTVSGEKDNGLHEWSVKFDEHFTRPTSPANITIYEQGTNVKVDSIDVSTSNNVIYPTMTGDTTLRFFTPTYDKTKLYYVLFDRGIVEGTEHCGVQSPPVVNPEDVVVKLTCEDDLVYRYTDYTQGTCRNRAPDNTANSATANAEPKDCSCPDGTVVDERKSQYTKWLNAASPGGTGDHEYLSIFRGMDDPPVCEHPVGIECRVAGTEVDYRDNGEVYTCSPDVGGVCIISDQADGVCDDYEVRFLCPCGSLPVRHVDHDDEHPCNCFDPVECPACRGGAWGDPHYTSYDGLYYDLFDHCTHIFTKDCVDNTFAVYSITSNACSGGRTPTCIDEAYVEVGPVLIHLYGSPPTYEFTGTEDLSSISTTVTLQNGRITVYIRDLDVVVTFGRWELNVQVSSDYAGKLCGLLGDCNGETHNDMYIQDSTGDFVPATLQEFEEAHRVYNFTNDGCQFVTPQTPACSAADRDNDEEAICNMLTDRSGSFSDCHSHISPDTFYNDCLIDACFITDKQEGVCQTLLSYTDKCKALGVDVGPLPADCVPTCPQGQTFKCGPIVVPTCQHPQGTTTRDTCVHGCFCEDGKVLDVNGECVDPDDCIVCPFDHVIRFGLHPQPSCRNPEPQNQTRIHGCFCPEGSVLNDRTGHCIQSSSCPACSGSASGDPHYITYDGYRYDLFDHCSHVFTKDCDNNTFAVYSIASDRCSGGRAPTCIDSAVIEVPAHGVWIYLEPSQYTYTGVGGLEDVNIEVISGGLTTVRLIDYDVVVTYGTYFLSVRAPLSYRGKLCGLLGDCDGDLTNDFKLQNGTVVDLIAFEMEYRAPGITDSCTFATPMPAACDDATLSEAQTFCNSLLDPTGSYTNCHAVISPMDSYDGCVLDYCFLNGDDSRSTVCRVIQDYADECRFHGIEVGTLPVACQPTCPTGQTFRCGPSIPQSCQNPDGYDDGFCVEGCYCNDGTMLDFTGQCVDPTECTVCPTDRIVRYGYSPELTCRSPNPPDGAIRVIGCFCPLGYLVNDLTGKCIEATSCPACTGLASGDPHYLTYDGLYYDLFDHCSHLFTGDCVNNTIAVYSITSDRCSGGRAPTCIDRAVVDVPVLGLTIHLFIEGYSPVYDFEGVPSLPSNISIVRTSSRILIHFVDYDVYVWFGWYYLKVQVPVRFGDRLCGLLGNCNGDISDDWMLRDGSLASDVGALEREYRDYTYADTCSHNDPLPATCEGVDGEAEDFCGAVVQDGGIYAPCHSFIDPDPVFDNCVLDYCFLNNSLLDGPCRTILDYGDSCRQSGVEIGLAPEMCRPECPEGQSYRCGPLRPASCEDPETIEDHACHEGCSCNEGTILDVDGRCVAPEECTVCPPDQVVRFGFTPHATCRNPNPENQTRVHGCFCPKGSVLDDRTGYCVVQSSCPACSGSAAGDPHYLTYDGYRYDLFDHCSHVFTKDCDNNTFAVYSIASDRCSGGRAPTCIDSAVIEVPAHNVWINLEPSGYRFTGVGGLEDVNIEVISGGLTTVRLIDYDVVVTYGTYFLSVRAPLSYRGKLCGLLGDCDGDLTNDFKLQNGNVADLATFELEYRAPDVPSSCTFRNPVDPPVCDDTTLSEAQNFCNGLLDPVGSYANCHDVILPLNSFNSCVVDYCFLNGDDSLSTVCRVIQDYADECRAHQIEVGPLPVPCQPTCPPGQTFRCGPTIPQSCQNPDGYDDGFCVEGCYCNDGTIHDINGECVDPMECTVCQFDHVIRYGLIPQPSCRNPEPQNQTKILGCFCPEGMVLNDRTGHCFRKEDCPACSGSASGDPHYITYDGYRYDLFDHCSHVFTKDCDNNTFAVYSIASDRCSGGRAPTCIDSAVIEVPAHGVWIYLEPSQYTFTGVGGLEDVNIEVISGGLTTVRLIDYDVVVTYGTYFLSVRAPLSYRGKLCGLLGDCDGDLTNDFKLQNGNVADLATFELEYRAPDVPSSCTFQNPVDPPVCDDTTLSEAQNFCNGLLDPAGSYANCHDVILPLNSFNSCVVDYCFLNGDDSLSTVCRVVQDYADECRAHQIEVGPLPVPCQPTCPTGQTFKCGPSIPQSCQNPEGYDDGFCVEGCYCNDGTIHDITGECVAPSECTVCPSDRIVRYGYSPELTCRSPNPPDGAERVIGCFCPLGYLVNDLTGKCIEATNCPACTGLASGDPHYLTYDGLYYDLFDHCSHLFTGDCVNNTFAVYSITSDTCSGGRAPTCIDRAVVDVPAFGLTIHLFIEGYSPVYDFEGVPSLPSNISIVQTSSRILIHFVDYDVYVWFGWYYLKVQVPVRFGDRLCGLLGNCNGDSSDDWTLPDSSVVSDVTSLERGFRDEDNVNLCGGSGFMDPLPATCAPSVEAQNFCAPLLGQDGPYAACHEFIDPQAVYNNCLLDYCFLPDSLLDGACRTILDYGDSCRQSAVEVGLAPEACRPECPEGQSYRCGPLRPASCEDPETIEDHACHEGCYCNEGTILDVDGRCVAPEECTVCIDDHVVRFGSWPQPTCRYRDPEVNPLTRGCFCPKDKILNERTGVCIYPSQCSPCLGSAYGDPHYLSHDGLYFDLFDHCSHLFSGDCVDGTFAVYSFTSDKCSGGRAPTCVDKAVVDIPALNLRVILSLSSYEMGAINDTLERNVTGVKIANTGSQLILKITAYDVVVTFGRWYLNVAAPLAYSGKLCGLVGNGNGNITDDWMTRDGMLLADVLELERTYRADLGGDLSCNHTEPRISTGCPDWRMSVAAEEFCSFLTDPTGPYAPCHPYLSPNATYDSCVHDYCYSDPDNYEIVCQSIRSYADDCRANSIQVTGVPEECEPECLWDSEFTCGPVYPSTCADHDGEVGTPHCVEGCFCRPGYLRDVRGDCVEPTGCHFAECRYNYNVDIVFAIDTSESYGKRQFFYDVLDWVAHIVQRMEFSDHRLRAGVIIFGSDVLEDKSIALDEYLNDRDGLVQAIKSIRWKSHGTEIGTAIDDLIGKFSEGFGARVNSTKIGVFITDGNSYDDVVTPAARARNNGVILQVVGAGDSFNLTALRHIAYQPDYVYLNPENGRELEAIYTDVSGMLLCNMISPIYCVPECDNNGICVGTDVCSCTEEWTGSLCTIPVCTPECSNGGTCFAPNNCTCTKNWRGKLCQDGPYLTPTTDVNIIAVVDVSEDFLSRFELVVQFLTEFVDQLYIGENRTRLGVMLLGSDATVAVQLNITDREELVRAINDTLEESFDRNQNSNPATVLNDLLTAFSPDGEFGAEEAEINMALLFTDGDNTNNQPTLEAAMALGEAGITMQVVGVGSDDDLTPENREGLEAIAGVTGGKNVLYSDLASDPNSTLAALTVNLTARLFNPDVVGGCPGDQSYSCGVRIVLPAAPCVSVWNRSRDAPGCEERCFCEPGKVVLDSEDGGTCHDVGSIPNLCPPPTGGDSTILIIVYTLVGLFAVAICILCPLTIFLICIIRKKKKQDYSHRRLTLNEGVWNFGRADWEDEEKLIKMEQEEVEHESAFQGTGEDVVYASNNGLQDSSNDVKGLGIPNPMFAENEEGEYVDQDKEVGEDAGEEEQNEQEKQEELKGEEEEEGENLIDFEKENIVDGVGKRKPGKPKQPAFDDPTSLSLADRINLFHVGETEKEEKVKRPPPKTLVGKIKLFEAIQQNKDLDKDPDLLPVVESAVEKSKESAPDTSPPSLQHQSDHSIPDAKQPSLPGNNQTTLTAPQTSENVPPPLPDVPPPSQVPKEGKMSLDAWDKELHGGHFC